MVLTAAPTSLLTWALWGFSIRRPVVSIHEVRADPRLSGIDVDTFITCLADLGRKGLFVLHADGALRLDRHACGNALIPA
jgi:hypothetical protein